MREALLNAAAVRVAHAGLAGLEVVVWVDAFQLAEVFVRKEVEGVAAGGVVPHLHAVVEAALVLGAERVGAEAEVDQAGRTAVVAEVSDGVVHVEVGVAGGQPVRGPSVVAVHVAALVVRHAGVVRAEHEVQLVVVEFGRAVQLEEGVKDAVVGADRDGVVVFVVVQVKYALLDLAISLNAASFAVEHVGRLLAVAVAVLRVVQQEEAVSGASRFVVVFIKTLGVAAVVLVARLVLRAVIHREAPLRTVVLAVGAQVQMEVVFGVADLALEGVLIAKVDAALFLRFALLAVAKHEAALYDTAVFHEGQIEDSAFSTDGFSFVEVHFFEVVMALHGLAILDGAVSVATVVANEDGVVAFLLAVGQRSDDGQEVDRADVEMGLCLAFFPAALDLVALPVAVRLDHLLFVAQLLAVFSGVLQPFELSVADGLVAGSLTHAVRYTAIARVVAAVFLHADGELKNREQLHVAVAVVLSGGEENSVAVADAISLVVHQRVEALHVPALVLGAVSGGAKNDVMLVLLAKGFTGRVFIVEGEVGQQALVLELSQQALLFAAHQAVAEDKVGALFALLIGEVGHGALLVAVFKRVCQPVVEASVAAGLEGVHFVEAGVDAALLLAGADIFVGAAVDHVGDFIFPPGRAVLLEGGVEERVGSAHGLLVFEVVKTGLFLAVEHGTVSVPAAEGVVSGGAQVVAKLGLDVDQLLEVDGAGNVVVFFDTLFVAALVFAAEGVGGEVADQGLDLAFAVLLAVVFLGVVPDEGDGVAAGHVVEVGEDAVLEAAVVVVDALDGMVEFVAAVDVGGDLGLGQRKAVLFSAFIINSTGTANIGIGVLVVGEIPHALHELAVFEVAILAGTTDDVNFCLVDALLRAQELLLDDGVEAHRAGVEVLVVLAVGDAALGLVAEQPVAQQGFEVALGAKVLAPLFGGIEPLEFGAALVLPALVLEHALLHAALVVR